MSVTWDEALQTLEAMFGEEVDRATLDAVLRENGPRPRPREPRGGKVAPSAGQAAGWQARGAARCAALRRPARSEDSRFFEPRLAAPLTPTAPQAATWSAPSTKC